MEAIVLVGRERLASDGAATVLLQRGGHRAKALTLRRDDVAWLSGADGAEALRTAEGLALRPDSLIADLATLRARHPGREGLLVDVVRGRRRAYGRLRDADHLLLDDASAQQATATPVAVHRAARVAERYPGASVHDVTCSIGADLRELVAADGLGPAIGSDIDPARVAMAAHNVPGAGVMVADALTTTTTTDMVIADPARRTETGTRLFRPGDLRPALSDLLAVHAGRPLAVKCGPGIDYARLRGDLGFVGEVEAVSLDGAVREVCLWTGDDARPGRRATVLRSGAPDVTISDDEPDDVPVGAHGRYVIDPDGAVVRAGLVRHFAARHGLWQLDERIAYLTGDTVPEGARGFVVLDRITFRAKALRRVLAQRECGALEILVRGVDVDPDRLRAELKMRGARPHTVVITRIGRGAVAFVCEPSVAR